jgi:hypothetical protein
MPDFASMSQTKISALHRIAQRFSKKVQNHEAMVAIYAVHYTFARIHKTLRITPSMAAGLSDHVWSLEEIVMMADSYAPQPPKRGPCEKKNRDSY